MRSTIAISINAAWNIVNFRRGLIAGLQKAGFHVVAIAPPDEYSGRLRDLGVDYAPIEMDQQGISPLEDLRLLGRYRSILKHLKPDIYLGYTAKPNIYGSIAAHMLGIPVINNVAGLGTAFINQGLLTHLVSGLYRFAFRRSATIFFQNDDDRTMFVREGIVQADKARLLPGSGINVAHFSPDNQSASGDGSFTFLLIARLLWDKGIAEYVEAARRLKTTHPRARCQILGFLDVPNRTAVSRVDLEKWVTEGSIEYLGHADDVRPLIAAADCVVLPSYREGLPRALLEGAAMGKPLIATDVPGCRHVVEDGANGFLCAVRDAAALAGAMRRMIELPPDEQRAMGAAARARVEAEFDERITVESYLNAIRVALTCGNQSAERCRA